MRIPWWLSAALFCLICNGGCASLSKEACLGGDWYGIGYKDGSYGRIYSRLVEHQRACLEHNVSPDENMYRQGWDDGLKIYCTAEKGYDEGEGRGKYEGACPPELEPGFLKGYLLGLDAAENNLIRKVYRINREIIKSSLLLQVLKGDDYIQRIDRIEELEHELEAAEDDIADIYDLRRRYGLEMKTP